MKTERNKSTKLQPVIDDVKQYLLSSVIADAKQDEKINSKKFMDKTMKELMQMKRDIE